MKTQNPQLEGALDQWAQKMIQAETLRAPFVERIRALQREADAIAAPLEAQASEMLEESILPMLKTLRASVAGSFGAATYRSAYTRVTYDNAVVDAVAGKFAALVDGHDRISSARVRALVEELLAARTETTVEPKPTVQVKIKRVERVNTEITAQAENNAADA